MLGRLGMGIRECREAYRELAGHVFQLKNARATPSLRAPWNWQLNGRFDSDALSAAIKRVVLNKLRQSPENESASDEELENSLLKEDNPSCKVYVLSPTCHVEANDPFSFVTATSASMPDRTTVLSNYASTRWPDDFLNSVTIWEAARATSAASTFFEPIEIGPDREEFVDGATGANNPIFTLWNEAHDVWDTRRSRNALEKSLQCLVSVGTGIPTIAPFGNNLATIAKTLKAMATETERTAEDFLRLYSHLHTEQRYFRFNVQSGLEGVGLEEQSKMADIVTATRRYITGEEIMKRLEACANNLRLRECVPDFS